MLGLASLQPTTSRHSPPASTGFGITRFLDDGRIELDSNPVERSMRPIAEVESLCPSSSTI